MNTPRFSTNRHSDFSKTLRSRINAYFKTNNISKHANKSMVSKTFVMLFAFFTPLILINTGIIHHTLLLFTLYIISGLGMAGIGMGIMHDAIHGSYSRNRKVNKYLGYTMNLIGANATVWKIQHNVLHHTYTNIQQADDDINVPFFLRFSPHASKHRVQKFQHIYVWFFYSISTLMWITAKDFIRLHRYKKMGFLDKKGEYKKELLNLIGWKLLYYSYALALPLVIVPLSPGIIILAFLGMHMVTGLCISSVFQVAHIMPATEYPLADRDGIIENDWFMHQLATTSNFSPRSRFFSWLIGGLNYQVEHHLLPNICHIHYRKISHIVMQTAQEYGLPYHMKKTFVSAVADHTRMLRQLGKTEIVPVSS
ncbi:fatty acid desaturase family protein [Sinomicrobium sp. M5D2P9]